MKNKFVIQTKNGNTFDPKSIEISRIDIEDIAHSLSNMSRYAGHSRRFYSVAEHSVLTYNIARKLWPTDLETQWAALLHDATEAYVVDLPTPLKVLLPKFMEIESSVAQLIDEEFDINWSMRTVKRVKKVDMEALATEAPELFTDVSKWDNIKGLTKHTELLQSKFPLKSGEAKHLFLKAFNELKKRMNQAA